MVQALAEGRNYLLGTHQHPCVPGQEGGMPFGSDAARELFLIRGRKGTHHCGHKVGALVQHGVGDGKGGRRGAALRADAVRQLSIRHLIKGGLRRIRRRVRDLPVRRASLWTDTTSDW